MKISKIMLKKKSHAEKKIMLKLKKKIILHWHLRLILSTLASYISCKKLI